MKRRSLLTKAVQLCAGAFVALGAREAPAAAAYPKRGPDGVTPTALEDAFRRRIVGEGQQDNLCDIFPQVAGELDKEQSSPEWSGPHRFGLGFKVVVSERDDLYGVYSLFADQLREVQQRQQEIQALSIFGGKR